MLSLLFSLFKECALKYLDRFWLKLILSVIIHNIPVIATIGAHRLHNIVMLLVNFIESNGFIDFFSNSFMILIKIFSRDHKIWIEI